MDWQTPEITDLGSISENTFTTPGGDHKGFPDPTNTDGMYEISHS